MELVANNSERELLIKEAMHRVEYTLIELTANLMRVTRGAGKPYEILSQALEFIKSSKNYDDVAGHAPHLEAILTVNPWCDDPENVKRISYSHRGEIYAEDEIIRGALQMVASRLLGQNTQEQRGSSELHDGMRRWEEAIAQRNKQFDEERIRDNALKAQRRKIEKQFVLAPNRKSELIDEKSLFLFHEIRDLTEIPLVEQTLAQMGFETQQHGLAVSYTYSCSGHVIYADPRRKGRIEFNIYKEAPSSRKRSLSAGSFYLLETWTDLPGKFQKRVAKLTQTDI